MVKNDDGNFRCEECGLHYREKKRAESCEKFCRENDACSIDIIAHAIENSG